MEDSQWRGMRRGAHRLSECNWPRRMQTITRGRLRKAYDERFKRQRANGAPQQSYISRNHNGSSRDSNATVLTLVCGTASANMSDLLLARKWPFRELHRICYLLSIGNDNGTHMAIREATPMRIGSVGGSKSDCYSRRLFT